MALKIKLKKFTDASGNPTTAQLEDGEVGINPVQQKVFVNNSGTIVELAGSQDLDLSAVAQSILPSANNTFDLGSSTKRWKDIYLSSNSIDLAGATISSDGTGAIQIAATGATLPEGSKAGTNKIAVSVTGSGGAEQNAIVVPFFSNAGGLTTANANFNFNSTVDEKFVYTGSKTFTLSTGANLSDSNITLFQF
tara:strand:- start:200 stop:781 length:582 start_codon:yes stop_codon:yes gene_type:complete